ncbi:hypothetical protein ACLOJK_041537 [Asimina triloba]
MISGPQAVICSVLIILANYNSCSLKAQAAAASEDERYHFVRVSSQSPSRRCSSAPSVYESENAGSANQQEGLRIVHRRGPCSPFGPADKAAAETTRQLIRLDQSRVDSLQARIWRTRQQQMGVADLPAELGTSLGTLNYIVTVGFGSPSRKLSLAFDTGSDVTWIQCKPCSPNSNSGGGCYTQQEPLFDPSQSTSYRDVSCTSSQCSQLKSGTGNPGTCSSSSTCQYMIGYGDGSTTSGSFAQETLTLTPNDIISNFYFGCGHDNQGLFGSAAGLLGLGRHPLSIVQQTSSKYNRAFSYCLPASSGSSGYLKIGSDAMSSSSSNVKFTQLEPGSNSFYFLDVTGIKVGGQELPPQVFANGGTIIDSGTVVSRLPPSAYAALRSAFRQAMANYTMAKEYEIFDTCYDFSGLESVTLPKIVLRFAGDVEVDVDATGIILRASANQFCLAFAGNKYEDSVGIIGNRQQRTYDIVYDVAGERVGFGAGGCS